MRKIPILLSAIVITVYSCKCNNGKVEEETIEMDSAQTAQSIISEDSSYVFNPVTQSWINQRLNTASFNWKRFKLLSFWAEEPGEKTEAATTPDFYNRYASVLRWSPDSSYVLDIGSYGGVVLQDTTGKHIVAAGEPDTEVSILFPKEKKKTRILFGGPSLRVFNGSWADSSQVVILGSLDTAHVGRPDTLLWLMDVKEHFFRKYKWQ